MARRGFDAGDQYLQRDPSAGANAVGPEQLDAGESPGADHGAAVWRRPAGQRRLGSDGEDGPGRAQRVGELRLGCGRDEAIGAASRKVGGILEISGKDLRIARDGGAADASRRAPRAE